jgi:two-component system, NarL family, response regulator NreC
MSKLIRILIADDHTIVRSGLRLLLESEPDIEVVGEAFNGQEAIEKAEVLQPDVILMDITMPDLDGLEATSTIKKRYPHIQVIALTMHRSDEYFFEMLKSGASGYLLKGAETGELMNAVRTVAGGEVYLYPSMARKLVQGYLQKLESEESPDLLTAREREVMLLLVEGYSNNEIAEKLVLSASTIHTHRGNIMKKLNLSSRHELMQYARQNGLI